MKDVSEIIACVVDYGTFICLADRISQDYEKTYFYSPIETEYRDVKKCVIGDGLTRKGHRIERLDEFITPEIIKEVDLFIFPDIGWGGAQRYLRDVCKKAVWGSFDLYDFELYRTRFLELLKKHGLPVIPFKKIVGLSKLADYLKDTERKWVKINRYRENMETWFHLDWEHSQRKMEELAVEFGGVKELIVFVVQDDIEGDEIGYDGWCVDGWFPDESFQGYEGKNELYLGSRLLYEDLPEEITFINE